MMDDAATCGHAIRGNDNRRKAMLVDRFGLLHGPRERHPARYQWILSVGFQTVHFQVVLFSVVAINLEGIHRHRAVHIDRKDRNLAFFLQLADVVENLLRAADRKRWNQHGAAASCGLHDNITQRHFAVMSFFLLV